MQNAIKRILQELGMDRNDKILIQYTRTYYGKYSMNLGFPTKAEMFISDSFVLIIPVEHLSISLLLGYFPILFTYNVSTLQSRTKISQVYIPDTVSVSKSNFIKIKYFVNTLNSIYEVGIKLLDTDKTDQFQKVGNIFSIHRE